MSVFILLAAAVCQIGVTVLLYYARSRLHFELLQDDLIVFLLPGLLGFGLFLTGFSVAFSETGNGYDRPMSLLASAAAAFVVVFVAIAICVRYLGS
jgi:hypothetical protein